MFILRCAIVLATFFQSSSFCSVGFQEIESTWDQKAAQWESYLGDNAEKEVNRKYQSDPVLWKLLGDIKEKTVLDAGCGTGYLSFELEKKGASAVGVDLSQNMITIAKEKASRKGSSAMFVEDNIAELSRIGSESIDKVVSNYVLMDSPDIESCIKSFYRVLKPGGEVVLVFLHPCFPIKDFHFDIEQQRSSFNWDFSYFSEKALSLPPISDEFSSGFTVFHRPLSTYWKVFKESGFTVLDICEPTISGNGEEDLPQDLVKQFKMQPISIAFHLRKNG